MLVCICGEKGNSQEVPSPVWMASSRLDRSYLLVLLADVVQAQGGQEVFPTNKKSPSLFIQQQGIVAAGPLQLIGTKSMTHTQIWKEKGRKEAKSES